MTALEVQCDIRHLEKSANNKPIILTNKRSANDGDSVLISILFYLTISGSSQCSNGRIKEILKVSQRNNK